MISALYSSLLLTFLSAGGQAQKGDYRECPLLRDNEYTATMTTVVSRKLVNDIATHLKADKTNPDEIFKYMQANLYDKANVVLLRELNISLKVVHWKITENDFEAGRDGSKSLNSFRKWIERSENETLLKDTCGNDIALINLVHEYNHGNDKGVAFVGRGPGLFNGKAFNTLITNWHFKHGGWKFNASKPKRDESQNPEIFLLHEIGHSFGARHYNHENNIMKETLSVDSLKNAEHFVQSSIMKICDLLVATKEGNPQIIRAMQSSNGRTILNWSPLVRHLVVQSSNEDHLSSKGFYKTSELSDCAVKEIATKPPITTKAPIATNELIPLPMECECALGTEPMCKNQPSGCKVYKWTASYNDGCCGGYPTAPNGEKRDYCYSKIACGKNV